jgi:hypothetical protein
MAPSTVKHHYYSVRNPGTNSAKKIKKKSEGILAEGSTHGRLVRQMKESRG